MKLTERQIRDLIRNEILSLPSHRDFLLEVFDKVDSALGIAKATLDDIESATKKIAKKTGDVKGILDSPIIKGRFSLTVSSALGNFRKFVRKGILKPIKAAQEILDIAEQLKEVLEKVESGEDLQTAIELVFAMSARELVDKIVPIIALAYGGIFGMVIAEMFKPYQKLFDDAVDRVLAKLDADALSVDWDGLWEIMCKNNPDTPMCSLHAMTTAAGEIGTGPLPSTDAKVRSRWSPTGDLPKSSKTASGSSGRVGSISTADLPMGSVRYDRGKTSRPAVMLLQRALTKLGAWSGGETGRFDKDLRRALRKWQKSAGVAVDGKYGKNTKKAMASQLEQLAENSRRQPLSITRRELRRAIREELLEGKKASKSTGKPYKGSRRGKTESQAQQMAAGIALSAREKDTKEDAIAKLTGAPKQMAQMSLEDLRKLATIRRGSEVPDSTKKGHERAALPGHISKSKKAK